METMKEKARKMPPAKLEATIRKVEFLHGSAISGSADEKNMLSILNDLVEVQIERGLA